MVSSNIPENSVFFEFGIFGKKNIPEYGALFNLGKKCSQRQTYRSMVYWTLVRSNIPEYGLLFDLNKNNY